MRPDDSEHVVYTNYIGEILIKELRSGSDRWLESRRYDDDARRIERANPSAVTGYDDSQGDLDVVRRSDQQRKPRVQASRLRVRHVFGRRGTAPAPPKAFPRPRSFFCPHFFARYPDEDVYGTTLADSGIARSDLLASGSRAPVSNRC